MWERWGDSSELPQRNSERSEASCDLISVRLSGAWVLVLVFGVGWGGAASSGFGRLIQGLRDQSFRSARSLSFVFALVRFRFRLLFIGVQARQASDLAIADLGGFALNVW